LIIGDSQNTRRSIHRADQIETLWDKAPNGLLVVTSFSVDAAGQR
jgi:hypothetical protein